MASKFNRKSTAALLASVTILGSSSVAAGATGLNEGVEAPAAVSAPAEGEDKNKGQTPAQTPQGNLGENGAGQQTPATDATTPAADPTAEPTPSETPTEVPTPVFLKTTLDDVQAGTPVHIQLVDAHTTFTGDLPTGLTLVNGLLSGAPTVAASSTFHVKATNAENKIAEQTFTLNVTPAPEPTPTAEPTVEPSATPTHGATPTAESNTSSHTEPSIQASASEHDSQGSTASTTNSGLSSSPSEEHPMLRGLASQLTPSTISQGGSTTVTLANSIPNNEFIVFVYDPSGNWIEDVDATTDANGFGTVNLDTSGWMQPVVSGEYKIVIFETGSERRSTAYLTIQSSPSSDFSVNVTPVVMQGEEALLSVTDATNPITGTLTHPDGSTTPLPPMSLSGGNYSGQISTAGLPTGNYVVTITDGTHTKQTSFKVGTLTPTLTVTTPINPDEMDLSFSGSGFTASSAVTCNLFHNGSSVHNFTAGNTTTNGVLPAVIEDLSILSLSSGTYQLECEDAQGHSGSTPIELTSSSNEPFLYADTSIIEGAGFSAYGTGFADDTAFTGAIYHNQGDTTPVKTLPGGKTLDNGSFEDGVASLELPPGDYWVKFSDGNKDVWSPLKVLPAPGANPTIATSGAVTPTSATFTGTCGDGDGQVQLLLDGQPWGTPVDCTSGHYSIPFTSGSVAGTTHTFSVENNAGISNTVQVNFPVTPTEGTITDLPSKAEPGEAIKPIEVTGFKPGEVVTFTLTNPDGVSIVVGTCLQAKGLGDAAGASCSLPNGFTLPADAKPGTWTLTATGNLGTTAVSEFVVEGETPQKPTVVVPTGEHKVGEAVSISGTGKPGDSIEIWVGGKLIKTVTVDPSGKWSWTYTPTEADAGKTLEVVAKDITNGTQATTSLKVAGKPSPTPPGPKPTPTPTLTPTPTPTPAPTPAPGPNPGPNPEPAPQPSPWPDNGGNNNGGNWNGGNTDWGWNTGNNTGWVAENASFNFGGNTNTQWFAYEGTNGTYTVSIPGFAPFSTVVIELFDAQGNVIASQAVTADANGVAHATFTGLSQGVYDVKAYGVNAEGKQVTETVRICVGDAGQVQSYALNSHAPTSNASTGVTGEHAKATETAKAEASAKSETHEHKAAAPTGVLASTGVSDETAATVLAASGLAAAAGGASVVVARRNKNKKA